MTRNPPSARPTPRRIRPLLVIGLVAVVAAITAVLVHATSTSTSSTAAPPRGTAAAESPPGTGSAPSPHTGRRQLGGGLGEAGGAVPDGVTVFDDTLPAVANLDPDLLEVLRRAATDAGDDGVSFYVNSGWRSPEYQTELLRKAVATYGSEAEAARWVATADTSPHVSGDAVDLGRSAATSWLSAHGAAYGLCQIYANEPWHYELRADATDGGCPRQYADPTHDPRMQQ
ncbi:M15 family metallopeptidase [Streptomyces sp. KL116D]|uniref:M15 family metallopeptidase n=1 Tax=Streptomyces sp. KL116D TaxID=3045152 RepID=UPI003556F956